MKVIKSFLLDEKIIRYLKELEKRENTTRVKIIEELISIKYELMLS
ncbi:hypothetical protein JHD48_05565 [Sulfurimonas sp. SAG-AH-194-I05]|nr:hypothetical protein [Sulfurimonas sp. SAG-AH-194-I05]MDF1875194.1 hypothetical protein [Sulfurimonas sp. SAG-AH-194-I05]